ncbi:MAG: hypothetical protein V2A73_08630 [Pseudomonadota bacterium]
MQALKAGFFGCLGAIVAGMLLLSFLMFIVLPVAAGQSPLTPWLAVWETLKMLPAYALMKLGG